VALQGKLFCGPELIKPRAPAEYYSLRGFVSVQAGYSLEMILRLNLVRAALALSTLAVLTAPALAHVTLEVQNAELGSTYKAVLRIPHGCGTEPTISIRVQVPEGFYNVKPMPKAGWTLETVTGPYAQAYDNHGTQLTEGVKEIVWKDGSLPNEWYDEFVFRGTFAGTLPAGKLYFPTVQTCASGEEAWIDVTGDDDVETPAPSVELVPATAK
jgi:periplasmic copper chaperone A